MKPAFEKYLETIGMTGVLIARVEELYNFYKELCPEEITGIFISEYRTSEGIREYEEAAFFSDSYFMGSEHFIQKNEFNIAYVGRSIDWCQIRTQGYTPRNATDKSRLSIEYSTLSNVRGDFKASGENAEVLYQMFLKYFIPNIKKRDSS